MKKLLALSVVLVALAMTETSYGIIDDDDGTVSYVAVYKGTIKSSKTVVDVNDANSLLPLAVCGYWAVGFDDPNGEVIDSNAVIYDAKKKCYKKTQDSVISFYPLDPCNAKVFAFILDGDDGMAQIVAVGKGNLTKVYDDPNLALRKYVPKTLTGAGILVSYAPFDPDYAYTGGVTMSLILDSKLTIQANSTPYDVNEIIDSVIVPQLTAKDPHGWTNWPGTSTWD